MQGQKLKTIPFTKYTACGNNFVIVDEVAQRYLPEHRKSHFAALASDVCFGIGSDGLLVVQPYRDDILQEINSVYAYWNILPAGANCDFIFRLFEANGKEALSCGNGLLCIVSYLYQQYGVESATIMTEPPLAQPKFIKAGFRRKMAQSWCNIGRPRRAPSNVVNAHGLAPYNAEIDIVKALKISFRSHDLFPFTETTTLFLSGYLIFTGEPHLVIFPDECLPFGMTETLFVSAQAGGGVDGHEKRRNFGTWLIDHIGAYINKHYQNYFPSGVNVNFARADPNSQTIQYRCYERGIDRETLACGTGALAVAYIVKTLQLLDGDSFTLLPHRCNWYQPDVGLQVESMADGWFLAGSAVALFSGEYTLSTSGDKLVAGECRNRLSSTIPRVTEW